MKYTLSEDQKQKNRERAKEWYKNNKSKCYERLKKQAKQWGIDNKEYKNKLHQEWCKRTPWIKTYRSIVSRCHSNQFYIKKGIIRTIKPRELKELWFRDKAYNMKKPTIDRIDNNGNYTKDNCRYVELLNNLKRRDLSNFGKWKRVKK